MLTGPWKGGRGAGRARRESSVIVGLKNRVHVNLSEKHLSAEVIWAALSVGEWQYFVSKSTLSGRAKIAVFRDILLVFESIFLTNLV